MNVNEMNALQLIVNEMNRKAQEERSGSQMTLGALIDALRKMPPSTQVANLNHARSYRGYYCDLAFELGQGGRDASELLKECEAANGSVFEGYNGGNYTMSRKTPVWVANYGCCGDKLMAIHAGGELETAEDV